MFENKMLEIKMVECPTCDGTGEVHSHNPKCWDCKGKGKITKEKELEIRKLEKAVDVAIEHQRQLKIKIPTKKSWSVNDIIRISTGTGGFRVWRVLGIFLGGENQESVIELETLDKTDNTKGRMYVPEDLLNFAIDEVK